ncbi:MAG: hypothetical protein RLZZ127_2948 [Planctomycetota bacterium]|jgi:predicted aspartyl protease
MVVFSSLCLLLAGMLPAGEAGPRIELPPGQASVTVPLQRGGSAVLAAVRIAGQDAGLFLVDTGGQRSLIDAALADRLGLPESGRAEVGHASGRRIVAMRRIDRLDAAGLEVGPITVVAVDLSAIRTGLGIPVQGILAADVWMSAPYRLDLARRRITVFARAGFAPPTGAAPLPIEIQEGRVWTAVRFGQRGRGMALIDSGASAALSMPATILAEEPDMARRLLGVSPNMGINGVTVMGLYDLPAVQVLGLTRDAQRLMVQGGRAARTADGPRGVLGAGLLRKVVLTVDPTTAAAWVEPAQADAVRERLAPDLAGCDDLMLAAEAGDEADCAALLAAGADPRRTDRGGRTALAWAVGQAQLPTARLLIAHGAPLDSADTVGQTPLGLALAGRMDAVAATLREAGAVNEGLYRAPAGGRP